MTIKVWSDLEKRINSTKQPSGGTNIDVQLKDNCSIETPVFLLASGGGMPDYTYVEAFGHYYFVTDVVNVNAHMCEVHCKQDALATYKSEIGSTRAFVLYDTTPNSEIPDTRLASKSTPTVSTNKTTFFSNFSLGGSVIATVAGEDQSRSYVLANVNNVHSLLPNAKTQIESLFPAKGADINDTFFDTVIAAVVQIISSGNLAGNIQDVRWIPFTVTGSGSVEVIKNGQYDTGIGADPINFTGGSRCVTDTVSVSIPWQFSDWRNTEPYTQVYAKIPFVGFVNVPASSIKGKSSLSLFTSLDKITGDISMELRAGGDIIGTYGASTAAKIALGNSSQNLGNIVNSFIQAGAAALRADMGSMINSALNAYQPLTMTVGGVSSAAAVGLGGQFEVLTVCHDTVVEPSSVSSVMGTPAMQTKTLGSLSGYIQCQNASVRGNMRDEDRSEINGYLNGGFFYE